MSTVRSRTAVPGLLVALVLNWRAGRIADPVARLRFLRQAGVVLSHRQRFSKAMLAAAGLAFVLIPLPVISKAGWFRTPVPPSVPQMGVAASESLPSVWLVEKTEDYEVYSNGLRIEVGGAAFHSARRYPSLDRKHPEEWDRALTQKWQTNPAGIVYHTTESDLAPFEAGANERLQILAQGIASFVRRHKSYHYLIDRFGRIRRTVREDSIANHAGWSAWADERKVYVNLNNSFLAIAFEAQTRPQGGTEAINAAQIHSSRVLTQMLRTRYRIPASNCVTHAQVSVNPDNFRIGAHTDLAMRFPFTELGLSDNYQTPVPSIILFGFTYDSTYLQLSEAQLWRGLIMAQEEVREAALARQMGVEKYRALLRRKYKDLVSALKAHYREDSL